MFIFAGMNGNAFRIISVLWHAVRPSRIGDMPARVDAFWLRKGYDALTFFGIILTHSQDEADRLNSRYDAMKNHEMIHLRQAQATGDSWLRFYLLYIWYWLKIFFSGGRALRRKLKNAPYLLNPFEMEAYSRMYDLGYLNRCPEGATEWRRFAKMSLSERLEYWQKLIS